MLINKRFKNALLIILVGFAGSVLFFVWSITQSRPTTLYENSTDIEMAKQHDFDNCVILNKDNAVLIVSKQKRNVNYSNLEGDLLIELDKLKEKEFKIIMTEGSDYNEVDKILDIMSKAKVAKYKLLRA